MHALRVKELQDILVALHMPKTGPKPELVRRLMEMGTSVILVRHAGGKSAVEAVMKRAHARLAAERGQIWDETRPGTYTPVQARGEKRRHPGAHASHDPWSGPPSAHARAQAAQAPADPGVWARVLACDPFWAAADAPRLASTPGVVMAPTRLARSGSGNQQTLQRPFTLTAEQHELLRKDAAKGASEREYQVQIACVMIDDPVVARLHWPFTASVRVNQAPLAVMYRQPGNALGKAGRDPVVEVPFALLSLGQNALFVSCNDKRAFSVVVRVARRRTIDQVKGLVPAPAGFPSARAFVERALGGGGGDDDDDVIVEDNAILSLRCPISGKICEVPARTKKCTSLAVFDLDTYLQLNAGVRKWTCPHCGAEGRPPDIVIDGFLTRVLGVLRARSRDGKSVGVSRVEVTPDGRWRPLAGDDGGPPGAAPPAPWVETEAMNGVVLGLGGSVLHVPPELRAVEPGDAAGARDGGVKPDRTESESVAAAGGVTLDSDGEETDEEEEMRRAVAEARRGRPPPAAPEDDVIVIDDSDSDEVQEAQAPPNEPREDAGRELAAMTEAASALQRARDADARRAVADAAAEASAAAMVAVEAAAGAVAASFQAARDNQRLNSPEAYAELASRYYDERASVASHVSAADAARSRLSAASSQGHGGGGRVSAAAANAVPSPVEIARGGNPSAPPARETAAAPAANARAAERPALKVVFRMPNSGNAIASGSAASGDAQLEEWFSHEFGGNPNASNASNA